MSIEIPDPSFEFGITDWTASGGSIAWGLTRVRTGTRSLQLTTAGGANDSATIFLTGPFAPGQEITFGGYINPTVDCTMNAQINESSDVAFLRFTEGPNILCPASTWTYVSATAVLGASTERLGLYLTTAGIQPAQTLWIDDVDLAIAFARAGSFDPSLATKAWF